MPNSVRNYFRRLAEGHEDGALSRALGFPLGIASGIYQAAAGGTRALYEKRIFPRKRLSFPVVSVGNVTWGGTGKTPLVEYLARRLGERQLTVLILTRGYGHDEVEQYRHHLPRAVLGIGKNRAGVAGALAKQHRIDMAVLDDGLQHWALERDLEIITVNALNPFGNRKLLPRGILREPVSILKKAGVVVLMHANLAAGEALGKLKDEIRALAPGAALVEAGLEPLFFYRARNRSRVSLDRIERERVTTFSGVGAPRSFQLLLGKLRIKPIRNFEFPDHHVFSKQELEEIKEVSQSASADEIVTTEKDFYRAPEAITAILNPLVLATRLRISSGEDVLNARLFALVKGSGG